MTTKGLASWLAVWHPRYRWMLAGLLLIGSIAGGIVYLENSLLQGLVQSLDPSGGNTDGAITGLVARFAKGAAAPFVFLGLIFVIGICRAFFAMRRDKLASRMFIRSREDLECEILRCLLRRDDGFYSEHSMGEIINRLEVDLSRAIDRRETVSGVWWSSLLILSNLIFFGLADWRLAIVVVFICVVGTLYTKWIARPIQAADQKYFTSSDQVKMDFEDYLKAVPEAQVDGLFETIIKRFRKPQASRHMAYWDWVKADLRVGFVRTAWPVLAFLVTVIIVLWANHSSGVEDGKSLALIPVLIFALPGIFGNVTYLITLRINYQIAANSLERILEYEDPGKAGAKASEVYPERASASKKLRIDVKDASFQYRSSTGEPQGGISEVDAEFRTGRWYAVVGGAGSGKSTLVNMVLGRMKASSGHVNYTMNGETCDPDRLPRISTLMPQRVALFDTSIRENLLIGSPGPKSETRQINDDQMDILERMGLAAICRLKALEMRVVDSSRTLDKDNLAELRRRSREAASGLKIRLAPFEDEHVDPSRPFFDALIGGKTNGDEALEKILDGDAPGWLKHLAGSDMASELIDRIHVVVDQSRNLLELDSYNSFAEISSEYVDERVWNLRREVAAARARDSFSEVDRLRAVRGGLTCKPAEWGAGQQALDEFLGDIRKRFKKETFLLRSLLAESWQQFDMDCAHPYLPWRDNLLFASAAVTNQRARRRLDAVLIEIMEDGPWCRFFIEQGLEFDVGRNGARLSGGQGQLVSLARSLLRDTSLIVLDEPTSALDPANRARVGTFLQQWKENRVVISISHDPELAKMADEIVVLSGGRLVSRGSFEELEGSCETLRNIFKLV